MCNSSYLRPYYHRINQTFFPDNADTAEFLDLVKTWCVSSNSIGRFNKRRKFGNAAVRGDGEFNFLRNFVSWPNNWRNKYISIAQIFTLTAQTSAAVICILRCHVALVEDFLSYGQEFVLTARLQTDPIERCFGRHHQIGGGRLLIEEKNINIFEKHLKINVLIKEGVKIYSTVLSTKEDPPQVANLMEIVEELGEANSLHFNDITGQQKNTIFKTRSNFLYIVERNDVLKTMLPSDFQ